MIVTKLMGGLGNQMFQYAAGMALAQKYHVPLLLDDSFLAKDPAGAYTKREFALQQLNAQVHLSDESTLAFFNRRGVLERIFSPLKRKRILSEGPSFTGDFFKAGPTVYLDGFWQSEQYFIAIREQLLQEFTPRYELENIAGETLHEIGACESVAVHVRRGDYASLQSAENFHGLLTVQYYAAAMNLMRRKIEDCRFFIFSDDIEWCRQNFKEGADLNFIANKAPYSSADLFLMKACRHNIIANSSYSWWSAWLNTHHEKTVIAPAQWYAKPNQYADTIYCRNWIKI
jgi:hypothetical protein